MHRIEHYLARGSGVIGCSRYVADQFALHAGQAGRCHTVHNGFDPGVFSPDPRVERRQALLYVGRVAPEKGVHVLVDAFRTLSAERPELELIIVGPSWIADPAQLLDTEPALYEEIRRFSSTDYEDALLRRAGPARDRVRLLGVLDHDEVAEQYRRCAALIMPSLFEEPFGMPVVEAMASGASVVASRRGGLPELIEDRVDGYLVEAGDASELQRVLASLLDDPARTAAVGGRAASHAFACFTWSESARSLNGVLEQVWGTESVLSDGPT
jgi:glycosyltransferase involved in cell wall biosynthesis